MKLAITLPASSDFKPRYGERQRENKPSNRLNLCAPQSLRWGEQLKLNVIWSRIFFSSVWMLYDLREKEMPHELPCSKHNGAETWCRTLSPNFGHTEEIRSVWAWPGQWRNQPPDTQHSWYSNSKRKDKCKQEGFVFLFCYFYCSLFSELDKACFYRAVTLADRFILGKNLIILCFFFFFFFSCDLSYLVL